MTYCLHTHKGYDHVLFQFRLDPANYLYTRNVLHRFACVGHDPPSLVEAAARRALPSLSVSLSLSLSLCLSCSSTRLDRRQQRPRPRRARVTATALRDDFSYNVQRTRPRFRRDGIAPASRDETGQMCTPSLTNPFMM